MLDKLAQVLATVEYLLQYGKQMDTHTLRNTDSTDKQALQIDTRLTASFSRQPG